MDDSGNPSAGSGPGWVLHVGLPKTGTTSLQAHLARLRRSGTTSPYLPDVAVPSEADVLESHLIAWWCQPDRWPDFSRETQQRLATLPDELEELAGRVAPRVVFSSELIFWELRSDESLERLRVLMGDSVSSLLLIKRDPLHVARTLWLTHVVQGIEFRPFESWIGVHESHLSGLDDWVTRAGSALGHPNTTVMEYDTNINDRICDFLGLPRADIRELRRNSRGFEGLGGVFLALSESSSPIAGEIRALIRDHLDQTSANFAAPDA